MCCSVYCIRCHTEDGCDVIQKWVWYLPLIILKWSHISSCHPALLKILNLGMTVWSPSYFHLSNCLELPLQSHLQDGGSVTPYSRDNVWNAQSSLWSSLALASPDLLSQGPFFCPWLASLTLYHFCYSSPSTLLSISSQPISSLYPAFPPGTQPPLLHWAGLSDFWLLFLHSVPRPFLAYPRPLLVFS